MKAPNPAWQRVPSLTARPISGCPSEDVLLRLLAGKLGEQDYEQWYEHVSRCTACFSLITLLAQTPEEVEATSAAAECERADAIRRELQLAQARFGIAPNGIKLLRRRSIELAPDAGRLRLQRTASLPFRRASVCPLNAGVFRMWPHGREVALELDFSSTRKRGALRFSRHDHDGRTALVEFYEDNALVLSESVPGDGRFPLPALDYHHNYRIAFRSNWRAEFGFSLERTILGYSDLLEMSLYYLASGRIHEALTICREELPALLSRHPEARRLMAVFPRLTRLFPDLGSLKSPSVQRNSSTQDSSTDIDMGAAIHRILREEVVGPWSSRLPAASSQPEAWSSILRQLQGAVQADPENESFLITFYMLKSWIQSGLRANSTEAALSALGDILQVCRPAPDGEVALSDEHIPDTGFDPGREE